MPPCLTRIGCSSHAGTGALSQPYTHGHMVVSRLSQSLTLGTALVMSALQKNCRMQPARIYLEFDISDTIFTGILLLGVLFVLTWIIYLQEQIDWWFNDL